MAYFRNNTLPGGEYGIYLRKSRKDIEAESHGEGETLKRHEETLQKLAQYYNLSISEKYIFREVVSGETISQRPEVQRMLNCVQEGLLKGIFVMEVERLARGDTSDQGTIAKAFKYSNTLIVTPGKVYDPDDEADEEYFEFNLFMSRREYKTINRRIQRGRIASAKEGKFLSTTAPYGYKKVKLTNDKGFTLEIDLEQSKVIRMIYEWYTTGDLQPDGTYLKLGSVRIAHKLNDMGIKPMLNNTWSRASIQDILKNPVYTGKIRWSYRKEKKVLINNTVKKSRPDPKDDNYILVDGLHEAIIDNDTFSQAQLILSQRGHIPVPGNNVLKNPLTGLLYCGKCKAMMTRLAQSKKTPYDTVKCMDIYCDNISSPLYLVEGVIIDSLRQWLQEYKSSWSIEKTNEPYSQAIESKRSEIKQVNDKLDKIKLQKDNIHDLLEQGVYSIAVFRERNDKIEKDINDLENNISFLEDNLKLLMEQANRNDIFIPRAENILEHYYDLDTAAARNEALKEVVDRIEYVKNEHNKKGERDNKNFTIEIFPKVIRF